ncbi:ABC-2 type transport system permease protein [Chitinophaga skermanii]|uniref:ABC-2 type transport system permease protein n=1 Tax=Chitinophaga skermanii TaxID=331697 RepID=A0A327QVQ9_9BACT|nr:ABC transporter permease [Chitinophaga skermanii]RAJ08421.1 ABC-2 type transport system permease protein [Chitinophaga skermanii]
MRNGLLYIILREWKRIFSRPDHYLVLIVLPPIIFFFYAFIYNKQKAEDLPVAIWDEDRTALSRQLMFMLEETPSMHITYQISSMTELEQLMREGKIFGAVHFPKRMEKQIKSRHPVNISVYTNASNLVPGKLVYADASKVLITAGSGVVLQKFVKTGMSPAKAMALVQPLKLNIQQLYNPNYNYQQYLVPGLVTVALQMMIIMVVVLAINTEWNEGTMLEILPKANYSAGNIVVGKTIAHLGVSWLNFILMVGVLFPYFNLTRDGSTFQLFILFNFLSLACIGIGMMISTLANDTMLAADVGLFYTSPAFVFSGFTFPRWAMPWYDQYYAQLMPYTAFLDGFFQVYFMGLPLHYAQPYILKLLLFIGVTFFVSVFFLHKRIQKIHAYATA